LVNGFEYLEGFTKESTWSKVKAAPFTVTGIFTKAQMCIK